MTRLQWYERAAAICWPIHVAYATAAIWHGHDSPMRFLVMCATGLWFAAYVSLTWAEDEIGWAEYMSRILALLVALAMLSIALLVVP